MSGTPISGAGYAQHDRHSMCRCLLFRTFQAAWRLEEGYRLMTTAAPRAGTRGELLALYPPRWELKTPWMS